MNTPAHLKYTKTDEWYDPATGAFGPRTRPISFRYRLHRDTVDLPASRRVRP
jgi:hypothetical protein